MGVNHDVTDESDYSCEGSSSGPESSDGELDLETPNDDGTSSGTGAQMDATLIPGDEEFEASSVKKTLYQ